MSTSRRQFIALAAVAPVALAQGKPDFSGVWMIDPAKTTLDAPSDLQHSIEHHDPALIVRAKFEMNQAFGMTMICFLAPEAKFSSDGSTVSASLPPDLTMTSTSRWDGDRLVTESQIGGLPNGHDAKGAWSRSLSSDGKSMILDVRSPDAGRLVFSRK